MKDLVRILESLGYVEVRTYIQSGNAVFQCRRPGTAKDAARIAETVEAGFGFKPKVLLLSNADLERAVGRNPFPTDVGKHLHFFFLESVPEAADLSALQALKARTEQFRLDDRVFYLYTPDGFARSKVAERAERYLGVSATARNFNTVSALLKLADRSV